MACLKDKHYSFSFLKQLLILYGVALLLGACLAPFLMELVQLLNDCWPTPFTQYLSRKPLGVYIDRIRLIGMVIGVIFLFRKYKDLFAQPWVELQQQKVIFTKFFFALFFLGIFLTGIVLFGQLQSGNCVLRDQLSGWSLPILMIKLFLTSVLVSCLEEYCFRGLIFKNISNCLHPLLAVILSSMLFASLHFNGRGVELLSQGPIAQSFETAWYMFCGPFVQWNWIVFTNLTLLGIILVLLYQLSGSLSLSIVFHAGVAFGALVAKKMMIATDLPLGYWGSLRLVDSLYAVFLFFFVLLFLLFCKKRGY